MRRHPKLQPLSDDHHRALVLARKVKRAKDSLPKVWAEVRTKFAAELEPHFQAEEAWLFPMLDGGGEATRAERARADHARLRELAGVTAPDAAAAAEFAALLESHVRFEERELFPRIEIGLAAYEDASLRGLCHEGAQEAATGAMRAAARSAPAGLDEDLRVNLRRGE
jgi:iron-sulfur cluster repair protein YtfE (RIC family)